MQNLWLNQVSVLIGQQLPFLSKSVTRLRTIGNRSMVLAAVALCTSVPGMAQVPAVVATSTSVLPLAAGYAAGPVVTDACGDVYVYEANGTGIVEIQAGTGIATVIEKNPQGYPSPGPALYMDAAKKNLYFPDFTNFYTSHFDQLPIVNCAPGTLNANFASDLGSIGNYYYGTVQDAAGDAAGNVYFTTIQNVTQAIYKETLSGTTYTGSQIFTWKNNINYIAADAAGDVFFVDNTTQDLYALMISGKSYPATPTVLVAGSHFGTVAGLSLDPLGNLYVSDSKANQIFEVPLEKGVLNPADLFVTASVPVLFKVSVDASHNIYLLNYASGAVKLKSGSAAGPATAVGVSSGTFPVTYTFNAATTPTAITVANGTSTSAPFSIGSATTGACAVGTVQAPLSSCTVNPIYTPTAVGKQTSALQFNYAGGGLTTDLFAIGQGAVATIDPGNVVASTTTFAAPSAVTVDSLGNVFVTDTSANTLTEFPVGSKGVGTVVPTGALTLSGPKGVAVDPAGDIFIADTGNNRVVEIPVVAGVLANAATVALSPVLKAPQGVAVDGSGNLFIADTGDGNVVLIPYVNGALSFATAQIVGTGLSSPAALAFDQNGDLFVTEGSPANDVLELTAPVGSAAPIKVAAGFTNASGVTTDASNSLIVVDSGAGNILRYPKVQGLFGNKVLVGGSVLNPLGVAADANGNLYVTDTTDKLFAEVTRVTAALQFGGVNVGSSGTQTGLINSSGNLPLTFKTPDYAVSGTPAAGFTVTNDTCTGATIAVGTTCAVTATYSPMATQLNAEEDLSFAANGQNGTPVLQLIGTGAHITPSTVTLVLTSPAGAATLSPGQPVSFTATIGTGGNTAVAGGSVKFSVNGNPVATVPVMNGTAVLTQKAGLPAGSAVVQAVYTGDVINYSGSSAQLTENVVPLTDSLVLISNAPFAGPLSVNDNPANATGPAVLLTATVATSAATQPGGMVTFFSGTTVLGTSSVTPSTATATLTTTALRSGTTNVIEGGSYLSNYNLTAVYTGDSTYAGSTSNALSIAVVGAPLTLPSCATATATAPATCFANTTGASFAITPANPTITIASSTAAGQMSGATTLTVTSYGGWAGVLNFTCTGLPAYATCAPFPGAPLVSASTQAATVPPTTISFVINTNVPILAPTASTMSWWVGGLGGLLLLGFRRRAQRSGYLRSGQLLSLVAMALLLLGSGFGLLACGSSSGSANPYVTPAGTSKVTVTVRGAQNNVSAGANPGQVYPQDSGVPPVTINLVVQ